MKKVEIEEENRKLKSRNFDLEREIQKQTEFVKIGDEKLIKAYQRFDKKLDIINKIKKLLHGKNV